jgi:hypothetical protein
MNTPANSQEPSAGVVEKAGPTDPHAPPSFSQNRINCARMALDTARSRLASADDYDAAWRDQCIKEAQRKVDDARFYIRLFEQLQDRRAA